jgi:DNA-binding transcriptional ArsR family regulator
MLYDEASAALGEKRIATAGRLPRLTARTSCPILSHMVNYKGRLDHTFMALTDPTRRAILAHLERRDGASISELAKPFTIRLPAVMKHLDVLADAGLITRSKSGRTVTVRLRAQPMREAMEWLRRYERFWSSNLDRLTSYAESKEAEARRKGQ